jgi:outer membrane biosynthesis protein TonB
LFDKLALSGIPNIYNNFSYGMLFSILFHGTILMATIIALPFVAKKPIELLPSISVELIQISEQMNIPYAPKAAKIIEKVKTDNKKLLSEQAPPKEVEQEIKKQAKLDNQKDEIDLSKSKKVPVPEKKQEQVKLDKSETIPLPDKKIQKIETKQESDQQPSKENKKTVVKKEKKKKIEIELEKDLVIKEFVKKIKPSKEDKAIQASEYEKKEVDVDLIKGLIAKQYENVGEVKKKTDDITQSEDKSMKLTKLSVTTEYSIQMQYKDCWSPPMGAEYKKNNYLVTVKLDLEKNGRVKSREILERNRMGTDSKYRIFAEAVDRAILKCNPIRNLPPKTYENWSTMILRFNPEGMMVGE